MSPDHHARPSTDLASSVAIISSREHPETLMATIEAACRAVAPPGVVDVVINGNAALAGATAERVRRPSGKALKGVRLRVFFVACGDKAHAWNQYVHDIWLGSEVAFFVDGYARIRPDACALLQESLNAKPGALGATGVPSMGRTAAALRAQMLRAGGMHGNFCAIRGSALEELKRRGFRLPLGLYRTDGVIGAVLNFGLDPAFFEWDPARVLVHPAATWEIDRGTPWDLGAAVLQLKRMVRQGQGVLENKAVHHHFAICRKSPSALPKTAASLVLDWVERCPVEARGVLRRHPTAAYALRRLRSPRDWSDSLLEPKKLVNG